MLLQKKEMQNNEFQKIFNIYIYRRGNARGCWGLVLFRFYKINNEEDKQHRCIAELDDVLYSDLTKKNEMKYLI